MVKLLWVKSLLVRPPEGHFWANGGLSMSTAHISPRDRGRARVWAAVSLGPCGCLRACAELFSPLTGSGELVLPHAHEQLHLGETLRDGPVCCLDSIVELALVGGGRLVSRSRD